MNPSVKMTKTKKILPQEWIQDYFCPVIGVLSTPEVNALCHKNNLSMVELLEPFAKLNSDVTIRDPEGNSHAIPSLSLTFQDFAKDPGRNNTIGPRLLSDTVSSITEEPLVSRAFPNRALQLEAPGFTPWFDAWTKLYLQSIPCLEHEFLRHHQGCVFVVSSNAKDPLGQLESLVTLQRKTQHERNANSGGHMTSTPYPQYFSANIFKYYVLLHDVYAVEESQAQKIVEEMKKSYGSLNCHLLQINSRTLQNDGDDANPKVAENWTSMTFSNRFSHIETRLKAVSDELLPTTSTGQASQQLEDKSNKLELDHPLANHDEKTPPPSPSVIVPKLVPVTKENIAVYLSYNDVDRIKDLIEKVIQCLLRHCEGQLKVLHEIITNRKSRSLFSGAKRWFGQSKPGVASGTSVIYGREAPELQLRKLADLYFMLKLYKSAYHHYHTAKKDFQNDEAWNYYAGAAEMCALAQFMQGDNLSGKKYPAHYMEDSITKYSQVCQMPEFAVRASLFDALCLKYQGMFQESAMSYVRMTNEAKDLRSALLLEQAAYCYLMCNPPLVRKYAFHIILSGYRFSKSGQKKHSSRAYRQGFQVYKGRGWELSENHILYTLGHQSLLLKDHYTAASLFNELVSTTNNGNNPLQQMCHLREFFIVHHMREKEDKSVASITIPFFQAQQSLLDLSNDNLPYETLVDRVLGTSWQDLERSVIETVHGSDHVHLNQTCQNLYGPLSHNLVVPEVAIGEPVRLLLPVINPFQTPLLLKKVKLMWQFKGVEGTDEVSEAIKDEVIDNVTLEKDKPLVLDLKLVPMKAGEVTIHGIEYNLKALFPQSESTDYTIKGKQPLEVTGPRLNSQKDHKVSKTPLYMKDSRFSVKIVDKQPKLNIEWTPPENMYLGEIQALGLVLSNVGNAPMTSLHLAHFSPGMFSFDTVKKKTLFDFPLVPVSDNEDSSTKFLDILPIPLENPLHPGDTIKKKLWICAHPGSITDYSKSMIYSLYFAYNIPFDQAKKPLMRMLRKDLTLKILPCLSISAAQVNPCKHDDKTSQGVLLKITNDSLETRKLEHAYISQVGLISSNRCLNKIVSSNQNAPVVHGESIVLGLSTCLADKSEGFNFTHLKMKNQGSSPNLDTAPYVNFLKDGFHFPKEGAKISGDSRIIVLWKTNQGQQGLLHAKIIADESTSTDQVDHKPMDVFSSTESVEYPMIIPTLKKACRIQVVIDKNIQHDFNANPLCLVPFSISVENYLPENSTFWYKIGFNHHQDLGRFLGCTQASVPMLGQSKRQFKFHMTVSSPGLYCYQGLSFQMTQQGDECDTDEYIPLQVDFIVQ